MKKKAKYPVKTSMNLFYKPDRTTKPSTVALYVLFIVVIILGLSKWLVYDLWTEKRAAERELASAQAELDDVMIQLSDYDEVHLRYIRYSATDEELTLIRRMEVLDMLDKAVGNAEMNNISISGTRVQLQISDVTLSETAEIVNRLEQSPMVASTVVNTAATSNNDRTTNWWGETVGGNNWDLVQASIVIQLQQPVDESANSKEAVK